MDALFLSYILGGGGKKRATKKTKKKKPDSWFETCTVAQLKDLCKACKLPVSGTKGDLCSRLMANDKALNYGEERQTYLKSLCKEKFLVQSGNKYDQVLRLLHNEYGTGTVKRAATEIDDATGKEVLKKRKTTPSAKMMYTRVEKKMRAVSQKKYQTYYGSKGHAPDVYKMMRDFIKEHCIDGKIVDSDPMLALEMSTAVFEAFNDNWNVMERPGYESQTFREALDLFGDVLKVARPLMDEGQIENVVGLLESIEACVSGYGLQTRYECDPAVYYTTGRGKDDKLMQKFYPDEHKDKVPRKAGENAIMETILVVMPDYDKSNREEKSGNFLDSDRMAFTSMTLSSSFFERK